MKGVSQNFFFSSSFEKPKHSNKHLTWCEFNIHRHNLNIIRAHIRIQKKFWRPFSKFQGVIIFVMAQIVLLVQMNYSFEHTESYMGQFQDVISFRNQIAFSTTTAHTHKTMSAFCTTRLTRNTLKGMKFSVYSWHLQSKREKKEKKVWVGHWWIGDFLGTYEVFFYVARIHNGLVNVCF